VGQYFVAANLNKQEKFEPEGLKFMEHSWVGNDSVEKVMIALSTCWKRNKVIWCGDYAFDCDPYNYPKVSLEYFANYDLSLKGFIYNIDKKEKVDMALYNKIAFKEYNEWKNEDGKIEKFTSIIHPLPVLLKSNGDGGGGDYHNDEDPMLGHWSGDRIFVSRYNLKKYSDITIQVFPVEHSNFSELNNNYLTYYKNRLNLFNNVNNF
jgi:hypothetical protein